MPTAQARTTTRTSRGLRATRSSIRPDDDTSPLRLPVSARAKSRVQVPVPLVPMASCAHVPHPECQDSTATDRLGWPGRVLARVTRAPCAPYHGQMSVPQSGAAATLNNPKWHTRPNSPLGPKLAALLVFTLARPALARTIPILVSTKGADPRVPDAEESGTGPRAGPRFASRTGTGQLY